MNICPVCHYQSLPEAPWVDGSPSHAICPQCGTEFGYDDAVGLRDDAALISRHEELRQRWIESGSQWWSKQRPPRGHALPAPIAGVPSFLQPDGEFADELPKRTTVSRPVLEAYWTVERKRERPLSQDHLATIEKWILEQDTRDPSTRKVGQAFETRTYERQIGAATILDHDRHGLGLLTKAALLRGAGDDNPRDQVWRAYQVVWHVAAAMSSNPEDELKQTIAEFDSEAAEDFSDVVPYVRGLAPLVLVHHQPAEVDMLEPRWEPLANIARLRKTVPLGDDTRLPAPPWKVPEPGYLEQRPAGSPTSADDRRTRVVDCINTFLTWGEESDAVSAIELAGEDPAIQRALQWASAYWRGPNWMETFQAVASSIGTSSEAPDNRKLGERLVVVLRHGRAQLTWRVDLP